MERAHKEGCKKVVGCFQRFLNSEARTHRSRLSTLAAHQAKCQAAGREGRDQAKAGVLDLLVLLALHNEVREHLARSSEPFDVAHRQNDVVGTQYVQMLIENSPMKANRH